MLARDEALSIRERRHLRDAAQEPRAVRRHADSRDRGNGARALFRAQNAPHHASHGVEEPHEAPDVLGSARHLRQVLGLDLAWQSIRTEGGDQDAHGEGALLGIVHVEAVAHRVLVNLAQGQQGQERLAHGETAHPEGTRCQAHERAERDILRLDPANRLVDLPQIEPRTVSERADGPHGPATQLVEPLAAHGLRGDVPHGGENAPQRQRKGVRHRQFARVAQDPHAWDLRAQDLRPQDLH